MASELPNSNEECETPQGGTPRTPTARVPAVVEFKADLHLKSNDALDGRLSSPALERTELMVGEGANRIRAGHFSRHRPDCERRRVPDDRMLWKGTTLMRFAHFPTIN
jgi:hypothetical protein